MVHTSGKDTGLGKAGLLLAVVVDSVDISNGHTIGLLDGVLDLKLVCLAIDDEAVAVQFFALNRHFFCYYWLNYNSHFSQIT